MKLCKRGLHEFAGERCRECSCEQKRADYGANREKYRAIARAYALANRERAREKSRLWRAANPLKNRENCKAWAVANPEKVRERDRIRKYGLKPGEWDAMFLAHGSLSSHGEGARNYLPSLQPHARRCSRRDCKFTFRREVFISCPHLAAE